MDVQRQDDQLAPTYSSSVPIRDVVLKTCLKQWTIGRGGDRGSRISVLIVWHDDDDDDGCSKYVIQAEYKQIWCKYISLQDSRYNIEEVFASIRWANHYFRVFENIIIAVRVSLGRPYASCIGSILSHSMKSNALQESTNSSVALKFLTRTSSMI